MSFIYSIYYSFIFIVIHPPYLSRFIWHDYDILTFSMIIWPGISAYSGLCIWCG